MEPADTQQGQFRNGGEPVTVLVSARTHTDDAPGLAGACVDDCTGKGRWFCRPAAVFLCAQLGSIPPTPPCSRGCHRIQHLPRIAGLCIASRRQFSHANRTQCRYMLRRLFMTRSLGTHAQRPFFVHPEVGPSRLRGSSSRNSAPTSRCPYRMTPPRIASQYRDEQGTRKIVPGTSAGRLSPVGLYAASLSW